jgi:membrane protein implicated in regulation of membrane protease activity
MVVFLLCVIIAILLFGAEGIIGLGVFAIGLAAALFALLLLVTNWQLVIGFCIIGAVVYPINRWRDGKMERKRLAAAASSEEARIRWENDEEAQRSLRG